MLRCIGSLSRYPLHVLLYGQHVNNVDGNNKTIEGKELVWQVPGGDLYRVSPPEKYSLYEVRKSEILQFVQPKKMRNFIPQNVTRLFNDNKRLLTS